MVTSRRTPTARALVIAVALATAGIASASTPAGSTPAPAHAQAKAPATHPAVAAHHAAQAHAAHASPTRLSEEGYRAMRDVRLARLDIFNGNTTGAADRVAAANRALSAAEQEGRTHFAQLRPKKADAPQAGLWIPVDGRLTVEDDYSATPKKQELIAEANEHLRSGDHAKAMEQLRLAEVDVSLSRVLMPLEPTRTRLQAAERLMKDGKFYEANLELKRAEEGLLVDTEVVMTRPQAAAG